MRADVLHPKAGPIRPESEEIGRYAAIQSIAEIGLGSVVHSLHLPLGGHLLSLNQGFILTLAGRRVTGGRAEGMSRTTGIATVAAVLKSLSPAGKKLTPMLAISVQGFLYALGLGLLGLNTLGASLGMILLSLWGFLQPSIVGYLVFGKALFLGIAELWRSTADTLGWRPELGLWVLLGVVGIKAALAVLVAVVCWRRGGQLEKRYFDYVETVWREKRGKWLPARRRSFARELFRPWVLLSWGISLGFLVVSRHEGAVAIALYVLRVAAVAWLLYWVSQRLPAHWSETMMRKFPGLAAAVRRISS